MIQPFLDQEVGYLWYEQGRGASRKQAILKTERVDEDVPADLVEDGVVDVPAGPASKGEDHFSDEADMNLNGLVCFLVNDGSADTSFLSTLHIICK